MQTFPTEMSPYEVKASQRTDSRSKYHITGQNDLYQTSEFVKFVLLWFRLGTVGVMLWQSAATFLCIVGAVQGWAGPSHGSKRMFSAGIESVGFGISLDGGKPADQKVVRRCIQTYMGKATNI